MNDEADDPGFNPVGAGPAKRWSHKDSRPLSFLFGRTVAYVECGSEVKSRIGLTLFDKKLVRLEGHDWTISEANDALVAPIEKRFRYVGITVFFVGIAVTVAAAVVLFASAA